MIAQLGAGQRVCSEPPPDAATSILAKAALEASGKRGDVGEVSAKINDEFSTTVAIIAKRTAAVEFWRTTSFAYCQFLLNGWTDQAATYLRTAETIAPLYVVGETKVAEAPKP